MIKDIEAARRFNKEIHSEKKKKRRKRVNWREIRLFIKSLPKNIMQYLDYRIKRLRYTDSDIRLARIFQIPISQAWALGRDGGELYRKMKKGR
jgi:hypothetical protein